MSASRRLSEAAAPRLGTGPLAPPPAERCEADGQPAEQERRHGDDPGGEVEALVVWGGQHPRAELGHQALLDLVLRRARVHQAADQRPLAVGLRRLGRQLQRDAALQALHLVLEVADAGLGAVGGQGGGRQEQDRRQRGREGAPHHVCCTNGSTSLRMNALVHRPAAHRGDAAVAADHEGPRLPGHLEVLERAPVAVAQEGVAEAVLGGEGLGVVAHVENVDAHHGAPVPFDPLVPALEQRRLVAARLTPRGPEVEDHDLALVVGQRAAAASGQLRQLEGGGRAALRELRGLPGAPLGAARHEPVDEQREEREQPHQEGDREGRQEPFHRTPEGRLGVPSRT